MTTDKNGKELKVWDKVRDGYNWVFTIIALNEYSDLPIETISDMFGDSWTFASHFVELVTPAPVEATFTEAQVRQALDSAFWELMDGPDRFGLIDHVIKALNTQNHERRT